MIYFHGRANTKFSRGQALSESFILLGVFSLLIAGIQLTGLTQMLAVHTLLTSLKHAFALSLGQLTHSRINREIYTFENHQSVSLNLRHVLDDLRMAQPGFIRLSASSQSSNHEMASVTRSTFVDTGYGHGESDRHVQLKIEASNPLWRDAFENTSKEMTKIFKYASRVDHGWNRPLLSIDFIQPWEGVIPDQAKTRSREWND